MAETDADRPEPASEGEERPSLPPPVRDHLALQLRAAYNRQSAKPDYLGDPALPPHLAPPLRRLERRLTAQDAGTEAVAAALAAIADPPPEPDAA
ncbi:hypothetical protein [Methylobacterium sp. JK268]